MCGMEVRPTRSFGSIRYIQQGRRRRNSERGSEDSAVDGRNQMKTDGRRGAVPGSSY